MISAGIDVESGPPRAPYPSHPACPQTRVGNRIGVSVGAGVGIGNDGDVVCDGVGVSVDTDTEVAMAPA